MAALKIYSFNSSSLKELYICFDKLTICEFVIWGRHAATGATSTGVSWVEVAEVDDEEEQELDAAASVESTFALAQRVCLNWLGRRGFIACTVDVIKETRNNIRIMENLNFRNFGGKLI